MDVEAIQRMVDALDREVPREDAVMRLDTYCGPEEMQVVANRGGFLRLGIEMMKAAFAEPSGEESGLEGVDLAYLQTTPSDSRLVAVDRRTDMNEVAAEPQRWAQLLAGLVFAGCALAAVLAVVGAVAIVRWLLF